MVALADWFAANRYKPKYEFMARVQGKYKGVPFVGSMGNDTVISDTIGPVYNIHLDLPMKVGGKVVNHLLNIKHRDIKELKRRETTVDVKSKR